MRIVYIVRSLVCSGGYEKVITYKANYLAEVFNHDVTIVAFEQHGRETFYKLSDKVKLIDLGLTEYKTTQYAILNLFIRYAWKHKLRTACAKYLKKNFFKSPADIIITTFIGNASFMYKLGGAKRFIVEHHGTINRFRWYSNNFFRRIHAKYAMRREVALCKHYDRVILLTEEERQRYWSAHSNVEVIPNPITLPEPKAADLSIKRVIAVGRFSKQKAFPQLVQAWSTICRQFPDWKLSIIGDQSDIAEVEKVKAAIASSGAENIELLPPTKDIVSEYARSSVFALSSLYEGFGLVLTEAMACGVPCVSFACQCGPKDIITDGEDGILVAEGDIQGFADALSRLMSNEAERRRMGANALTKAERFALPSVMQRWQKLFTELCE